MKDEVPCKGFTLIELSLSMIFIAILSLTVVLLIQNTTASYRRGLVLNQINTVGMDLIDDFRVSVQNASSFSIPELCRLFYGQGNADGTNTKKCQDDNGDSLVRVTRKARVIVDNEGSPSQTYPSMPVFGAFCTGTYTYIWNSGYFETVEGSQRQVLKADGSTLEPASLKIGEDEPIRDFRLLKVYDEERSICRNAMADQQGGQKDKYTPYEKLGEIAGYENDKIKSEFRLDEQNDPNGEGAVKLLKGADVSDLVLYDLYIAKPALSQTRGNLFLSASIILGTRRGGINIREAGNSCKPPSDDYSELEYCAINKFNFAVQAGGE